MTQYTGKVSKIFTSRFGGSFGLDGQHGLYFNTKNALPDWVREGCSVSFDGQMGRNGKSFQVNDASLKLEQPQQQSQNQSAPSRVSTDESIRYQSSRKDALAMVAMLVGAGVLFNDNTPKAKVAGIIEDAVDRFTAVYFEDIETLGALDRTPVPEAPKAPSQTNDSLPE